MVGEAVILGLIFVLLAGKFANRSGGEKKREPKINGKELFTREWLRTGEKKKREPKPDGKELFTREWLPGDRRSHAGDGLGPLFNASSCVACHRLGGVGGAGPKDTNVTVVSAVLQAPGAGGWGGFSGGTGGGGFGGFSGGGGSFGGSSGGTPKPQQPERSELAKIHPALRTQNSFPLHRFGTEKEFAKWKREFLGPRFGFKHELDPDDQQFEALLNLEVHLTFSGRVFESRQVGASSIQLIASQRNAPPVFGAGLVDRIPDRVLEEVAASQAQAAKSGGPAEVRPGILSAALGDSPLPVSGRVARLRDGRVGRFGWKAQTASLREFTLQACASELGLEVPGFPQAAPPWKAGYKAPGLDLSAEQCDALVHFVASLPPPVRKPPETEQHAAEIAAGDKLFARIGCAACHRPRLGDVEGMYSDLLLHDMGPALTDRGQYGGSIVPGEGPSDGVEPLPIIGSEPDGSEKKKPKFGAAPGEWRTPPLWGLRDSAPYLHDGRADTIRAAVLFHGGEGLASGQQFFRLSLRERQQVELFLQSLGVPR
jgi:CxxC motif-containing protein (DUF1111 family)